MPSSVLTLTRPGAGNTPQLMLATVSGRAENWFFVDGVENCERCLRAESCLLEPEIGDTVLLCVGGSGTASYILSILSRMSCVSMASISRPLARILSSVAAGSLRSSRYWMLLPMISLRSLRIRLE